MTKNSRTKKNNRTLAAIADDLRICFKREVADVVEIGGLPTEAKTLVTHGEWLPWLAEEFSLSERSAQRFMRAHALAKTTPVSDLKLMVSALFVLGELEPPEINAVLREAKARWISGSEARKIVSDYRYSMSGLSGSDEEPPGAEPPDEGSESSDEPPLPPPTPPTPSPRDLHFRDQFAAAVRSLMALTTKPSAKFAGAVSADDLETVANFLKQVAAAKSPNGGKPAGDQRDATADLFAEGQAS
jgi:Protein of unknown function (DUF3102)